MTGNIVIFSRSLPMYGLGGMEVAAWDLAVGLTRLGYRVVILTTSIPGEPKLIEQDGVLIETFPVASGGYSREWWKSSRSHFKSRYMTSASCVISVSSAVFSFSLSGRIPDIPFCLMLPEKHSLKSAVRTYERLIGERATGEFELVNRVSVCQDAHRYV